MLKHLLYLNFCKLLAPLFVVYSFRKSILFIYRRKNMYYVPEGTTLAGFYECSECANRFLSTKGMVRVFGSISKYIFFWHVPLFSIFGEVLLKLFPDSVNNIFIGYLITLYVFCTVYRLIETKIRSWRRSIY